jgi:hypothetical protein
MSVSKAQSKESTYNDWFLLYTDTLSNNFSAELEGDCCGFFEPYCDLFEGKQIF